MQSEEIRQRFLRFFEANGHTVVPSASLLSADPTTLFIIAGMAPFKPYFLGQEPAPYARATSVQKCVRTQDIDVVGTTARHVTFFQMAGNFSFGDYFKSQAIPYAWELLTGPVSDGGFGFPEDRLWATVYHDDDEAADIWTKTVGVPAERVQRRGKEDNYWSMGGPGPCGPCSEIYYDRGPAYGREGGPVADEDRYLEVWNLVFMQYERGPGEGYDYPILGDLPAKNIDTGLGIDRMATVLQGVDNIYETDLLRPILDLAGELAGVKYGAEQSADVRLRIIADHTRTATMLLADGVIPGNEGRGYVLRRLLRRVVRSMRLLGYGDPVMGALAGVVRDTMGPSYPELVTDFGRIEAAVVAEEESFRTTLVSGERHFARMVAERPQRISGADAFTLHDTYGFPVEITLEMAAEAGLSVDEDGFTRLMEEQRRRAREDRLKTRGNADVSAYRALLDDAGPSAFTGYDEVVSEGTVRGVLAVGDSDGEVEVVLDRTPFYAESGGQLADAGLIRLADGTELEVYDVQRPVGDLIVHRARVRHGEPLVGAEAVAEVDVERRRSISRSHTATHLVHQAIRSALGETAAQAGSLNAPGRLRFDFSAPGAVPASVLADVEQQVNEILVADLPVRAFVTTQAEARKLGAIALFGEKYGDAVRVVEVGDYARELCGGTHAQRSGQLGVVKLLGESSIAAGTRRVDGLVGIDAFRFLAREHVLVNQLADQLKARPEELPERIAATVARLREAEKELERMRAAAVLGAAAGLAANPTDVFGVAVVTSEAPPETSAEDLRRLALDVRGRIDPARPAAVVVGSVTKGRPVVVVAVNDTGRQWGLAAGALIRGIAPVLGGGGGGKDDVAQGGGTKPEALGAALDAARDLVGRRVTGG
ncbi:MAG: alanine--tRNA ligase [Frankiaceae bacterium]